MALASVDWTAVEAEAMHIIENDPIHGTEADIVRMFKGCCSAKQFDDRLPMSSNDTVVYEMSFRFGRADIVIFHTDGSGSVIEVKDGSKGYNHVVAGIGQAGLYAAQLGMNKGALTKVRKCLLWTSTGKIDGDAAIEMACELANTIALPWGALGLHLAYEEGVRKVVLSGGRNGGA